MSMINWLLSVGFAAWGRRHLFVEKYKVAQFCMHFQTHNFRFGLFFFRKCICAIADDDTSTHTADWNNDENHGHRRSEESLFAENLQVKLCASRRSYLKWIAANVLHDRWSVRFAVALGHWNHPRIAANHRIKQLARLKVSWRAASHRVHDLHMHTIMTL